LPFLPVRNLGGAGIVSDLHPYDLPPNALSGGVNVRFENKKITRGPVFREVFQLPTDFKPSYLFAIPPVTEGNDALVTVGADGSKIYSLTGGTTLVDATPEAPHPVNTEFPWSHTFLGSIAYLNQKDGVPLMRRQSDLKFVPLHAWPSNYRCAALRSYKDFLVALGVSQVGTEYPTMVKWSDFATFGSPPNSWAIDDTTNSAGENIVNEMRTPIIDGLTLRDSFIIYCQSEVWVMDYIGGNFMFRFRKLYDRRGVINQNCVVQVDGLHYVFDRNDIYVHDGASTPRSICDGKVKKFIFDGIQQDKRQLCFVTHDPRLSEIHFAYPSSDSLAGFEGPTTGCNRIASFNYAEGQWSFYDAPNVVGSAASVIPSGISYEDMAAVGFPDANDPYRTQAQDKETHTILASRKDSSQGITQDRLLGLDLVSQPRLDKPLCLETVKPSLVERIGIDLDEDGNPLPSYKVVHTIYPQLGVTGDDNVEFQFGSSDVVGAMPSWGSNLPFDPSLTTKVDTGRVAGRYLAWRLHYAGEGDFAFSGFDAKLTARGRRG
jgi:hypothetical protein